MSDQYYFMSLESTKRLPVCVIYARPRTTAIPDFPSDIPAVYWNFVYLVSHCVWDLLSTCETRSVPVKGEAANCNKPDSLPKLLAGLASTEEC